MNETYNNGNNDADQEIKRDDWNPTQEQMNAYLKREVEMAVHNLRLCLLSRPNQSFKDLRESMLHVTETVETVLTMELKSGRVKEIQGKFSLA